jgi:homoserine dehydrogenase
VAKKSNDGIEVRVNPTLIPKERLVANVDGPMNAVLVMGNMLGPTLYYGAGAGSEPTASAVVTDVIDLGRVTTDSKPSYNIPAYGFQKSEIKDCEFLKINQITSGYYLRASFVDSAGVLAKITSFFAGKNLSIDEMHQKVLKKNEKENDVIIVINKAKELDIDIIIEEIQSMESNVGNVIKIRLENLSK